MLSLPEGVEFFRQVNTLPINLEGKVIPGQTSVGRVHRKFQSQEPASVFQTGFPHP